MSLKKTMATPTVGCETARARSKRGSGYSLGTKEGRGKQGKCDLWSGRKGGGEGGRGRYFGGRPKFWKCGGKLCARCRRTIHFERLCASQTILLLYAHGMSLIIQILVEISPGTSLHNLTSLANLGTQKSVQQTYHTY